MAGSRIAPSEGGVGNNKKPLIIVGGIVVLAVVAYLALCSWTMGQDCMLPGTYISGVDVSGMTATQVEETMSTQLQQALTQHPVTVTYGAVEKAVDATLVTWDSSVLDANLDAGRESFLASGANYLARMMGSTTGMSSAICLDETGMMQFLSTENWDVPASAQDASYEVVGENLVVTKEVTGMAFDTESALADIKTAAYNTLDYYGDVKNTSLDDSKVILNVTETPGQPLNLTTIREELSGTTADAYMDENHQVVPHQLGAEFDVAETQAVYDGLSDGESISIPLSQTGEVLTTEEFEKLLFADELCTATTYVSGTYDRRTNVRVAAGLVNGTILLPGETFSYQKILKGCDPALGFLTGTGYVNGESVPVTGGGVCQVTSTLYRGMMATDLKVVERRNHSYVPGYVPNGMDATYYGGATDFKFTNNTPYPLKLVTEYTSKNYLTVAVVGTQTQEFIYVPKSSSSDYKKLDPIYVADESVPQGTIVTKQTAYTGCVTSVYREVYDREMNYLRSESLYTDYYKARSATYHYNPLDVGTMGIPGEPIVTQPVTPVTPEPEIPAVTEPEVPVVPEPEVPVAPVTPEPEVPAVTQPETPVVTEPVPETSTENAG